ncbi:hypothetical protein [Streptomyces pinistramenti]|uniref:hypothetical protein n=1 Tax=Streptomyces pinistramenti TaxID=2884812 RepID=UPI001D091B20|nr:hypothetical protein [Streptomyces pinistramenti]
MTVPQLEAPVDALIPAPAQRRERTRHEHRGGERRRTRGAGAKDKLSDADRILATALLGPHVPS